MWFLLSSDSGSWDSTFRRMWTKDSLSSLDDLGTTFLPYVTELHESVTQRENLTMDLDQNRREYLLSFVQRFMPRRRDPKGVDISLPPSLFQRWLPKCDTVRLLRLVETTLRGRVSLRSPGCCPNVVVAFRRYMISHMEIVNGSQKAPKDPIFYVFRCSSFRDTKGASWAL